MLLSAASTARARTFGGTARARQWANGHDDRKGGRFYKCSKCYKFLKFLPPEEVKKRKEACGCFYCKTEFYVGLGKSKEDAKKEAEADLEAEAAFD